MELVSEAKKVFGGSNLGESTVFVLGDYTVATETLDPKSSPAPKPPKRLLILYPNLKGSYPVLMFHHGFCLSNEYYTQLLTHVSSHGYIVVAPQLYALIGSDEVKFAGEVANWLTTGLQPSLPAGVTANLQRLALVGHSRGGKTAFALALGHAQTNLTFDLLIGIDPVAGATKTCRTSPEILTYQPRSFGLSIPVAVIGTGLGPEKRNCCTPPCAPDGVNHNEFFYEAKPPCYHFVAKEYGHMDMLDDVRTGPVGVLAGCLCKNGTGKKELMRRGVGGVVVALLDAWLKGKGDDLDAILAKPEIAPIVFDPVQFVPA